MHARACVVVMRAPKISLCQRSRLSLGTQTNRRDMSWALLNGGMQVQVAACLFLLVGGCGCGAIKIDNTVPRRDQHGNILNAHDGHIVTIDGRYWLFGTSYAPFVLEDWSGLQ